MQSTTTSEQDINTASQRKVNLIWEYCQAFIAIVVVLSTMAKGLFTGIGETVPTIMSVAFGTVIGFYFSRTNHEKVGGVGTKPTENSTRLQGR